MSAQNYYQQATNDQNSQQESVTQDYKQPYDVENYEREDEGQIVEYTFFETLKFMFLQYFLFRKYNLNNIKCSWIATIFSSIVLGFLIYALCYDFKFKFDHVFFKRMIFLLLVFAVSSFVNSFILNCRRFFNCLAVTTVSFSMHSIWFYCFFLFLESKEQRDIFAFIIITIISYINYVWKTFLNTSKNLSSAIKALWINLYFIIYFTEIMVFYITIKD